MLFDTELLLIGAAIAAIAIALVTYASVSKKNERSQLVEFPEHSLPLETEGPAPAPQIHSSIIEESQTSAEPSIASVSMSNVSVSNAPIQEAPAPFPEETSPGQSATPTDVTALANAASAIDATQGVLVIPTPKRRARTRRLPTEGAPAVPRKRRSTKKKIIVPETTTFSEPVPTFSDSSAADHTAQSQE